MELLFNIHITPHPRYFVIVSFPMRSKCAVWLFVRLLEWLPDVQEDVGWIKDQTVKLLSHVLRRNVPQQLVAR